MGVERSCLLLFYFLKTRSKCRADLCLQDGGPVYKTEPPWSKLLSFYTQGVFFFEQASRTPTVTCGDAFFAAFLSRFLLFKLFNAF